MGVNNCRPLSLLNSFSEVFEKVMHMRLYNYLEKIYLLSESQFGLRQDYATVNGLAVMTECLRLGNDRNLKCSFSIDLKRPLIGLITKS